LFEDKYIDLINCFKNTNNPLIICTTPFFPSLQKNKVIEKVALLTNSYLVDLSHLPLLESENYAKNEKITQVIKLYGRLMVSEFIQEI